MRFNPPRSRSLGSGFLVALIVAAASLSACSKSPEEMGTAEREIYALPPLGPGECHDSADCDDGKWCANDVGECGGVGRCEPRPESCDGLARDYKCGCDAVTYENACEAALAGVRVRLDGVCPVEGCAAQQASGEGECGSTLGFYFDGLRCAELTGCECTGPDCDALFQTRAACKEHYLPTGCLKHEKCSPSMPCDAFEVCSYDSDDVCGRDPNARGECVPRPTQCPDAEAPVCGCDGTTYANDCLAVFAGTRVEYEGLCTQAECRKESHVGRGAGYLWTGKECTFMPSDCEDCPPLAATRAECLDKYMALGCYTPTECDADAVCHVDDYCDYGGVGVCGKKGAKGVCKPKPEECDDDEPQKVCGCDGMSQFTSRCEARKAGVDVMNEGACAVYCTPGVARGVGKGKDTVGYAWDGKACVPVLGMSCTSPHVENDECGCEGSGCYDLMRHCRDAYIERGCLEEEPCGGPDGKLCDGDFYCEFSPTDACGKEGAWGVCKQKPVSCAYFGGDDVCGCDGVSYDNQCEAHLAGTAVRTEGMCPVEETPAAPSGKE